jgi:tRNA G18 (ribose-2'-O)-methylase SpoU
MCFNSGMSASFYQIRQCQNASCGLRFPLVEGQIPGARCPGCLGETVKVAEYALLPESVKPADGAAPPGPVALLDNIRSAWNVGAIFRSADGFGFNGLHLCGITPSPANDSVRKTSLGAEKQLAWQSHPNSLLAAHDLIQSGYTLFALELTADASPLPELERLARPPKIALVLGSEVCGVDPDILALCAHKLYIPMRGQKRSFNVAVAFAVAAYELTRSQVGLPPAALTNAARAIS